VNKSLQCYCISIAKPKRKAKVEQMRYQKAESSRPWMSSYRPSW